MPFALVAEIEQELMEDGLPAEEVTRLSAASMGRRWRAPSTAADAVGQSMDFIIPERLRGRHWECYHKVMARGASRYGRRDLLAVLAVTKDGRTSSIEFTIQVLREPAGEIVGPVATIRDVTKRFRRDKQMSRRLEELEMRSG